MNLGRIEECDIFITIEPDSLNIILLVTDEPDIHAPADDQEYEDVDPPEPPKKVDWKATRSLAVKYFEAGMRAAEDLNDYHKYGGRAEVVRLANLVGQLIGGTE
jgi:hypothetical protein